MYRINPNSRWYPISKIIGVIILATFFFFGVVNLALGYDLVHNGIRTEGVIASMKTRFSGRGTTCIVTVSFRSGDQTIEGEPENGPFKLAYSKWYRGCDQSLIGKPVPVYYFPKNPEIFIIGGMITIFGFWSMLTLIPLLALSLWIWARHRSNTPRDTNSPLWVH